MKERVRFGLIGYGLFGQHHARAIAQAQGAELAAIAVKSEASRKAAAAAHPGAQVLADYRELLSRDDIDVVDVVVPNALHFEVGRAVLEAGKHLLIEKPMCLRADECAQLIELAEARGRVIVVNHECRRSALWGGVKRLIEQGAIGKPRYCMVELSRFPYREGADGWRYDIKRVGNWILEEPIHFFDLARWYMAGSGDPVKVYGAASARRADRPELQDNFTAVVHWNDGGYAVISQTLAAFGHHVTVKVSGTSGAIWAWWSAADARSDAPTFGLRYGDGDNVTDVPFEQMTGELVELNDQVAAMVRCVRHGEQPAVTGADGRWAVLLCESAAESVRRGEPIRLTTEAQRRREEIEMNRGGM